MFSVLNSRQDGVVLIDSQFTVLKECIATQVFTPELLPRQLGISAYLFNVDAGIKGSCMHNLHSLGLGLEIAPASPEA